MGSLNLFPSATGTLELVAPNPMMVNLVKITGLDDVFEVRLPEPPEILAAAEHDKKHTADDRDGHVAAHIQPQRAGV